MRKHFCCRRAPTSACPTSGWLTLCAMANKLPAHTNRSNSCAGAEMRQTAKVRRANLRRTLARHRSDLRVVDFALLLCLLTAQALPEMLKSLPSARRSNWPFQFCDALKMINLDVPKSALAGDTIKLSCFYALKMDPTDIGTHLQLGKRNLTNQRTGVSANVASSHSKLHSSDSVPSLDSNSNSNSHSNSDSYSYSSAELSSLSSDSNSDSNSNSNSAPAQLLVDAKHIRRRESHQPSEMLYAIKWYKEEREFFRYLAQEWPHKQVLPLDGVQVDVSCWLAHFSSSDRLTKGQQLTRRSHSYTSPTIGRLC